MNLEIEQFRTLNNLIMGNTDPLTDDEREEILEEKLHWDWVDDQMELAN